MRHSLLARLADWFTARRWFAASDAPGGPSDDTPEEKPRGIRRLLRRRSGGRGLRFKPSRSWLIGIVVGILLLVGVSFLLLRGRQSEQAIDSGDDGFRAADVSQGTLALNVSTTGQLQASREARLPFLVSGEVSEVLVEPGDAVESGDVLVRLDNSLLELDLRDAELILALQDIVFDELAAGPTEAELRLARAALGLAQARLNQTAAPPDEYDQRIAELNIELARNQLYREQSSRDITAEAFGDDYYATDIGFESAQSAELGVRISELQREQTLQGASAGSVATARASVVAAQASLNALLDGPDEFDLEIAQRHIESAGLSVELARAYLEQSSIRAPFDGTVSEVNASVGDPVSASQPVVTVVGEGEYELELNVDEIDIANVRAEQSVEMAFDALPGEVVNGTVERIAPVATDVGGVVTYLVRVALEPTDLPLRAGMTATAVITVDQLENALLVPNWAIRIDRQTGEAFVDVRSADGTVQEISVRIGLRNDLFSEVLEGLEEGDEVVVSQERENISFFGGGE